MKNSQRWNKVRAVCSVCIQYLHPDKMVIEEYHNRYNRYVLKYLRIVCKDKKSVNRVHMWCIFLSRGDYKVT